MLTSDLLHVLDEPIQVEGVGVGFQAFEVDDHACLALVSLVRAVAGRIAGSHLAHLATSFGLGGTALHPENLSPSDLRREGPCVAVQV